MVGFTQKWNGSTHPVIPLIKTQTTADGNFLDVQFATVDQFTDGAVGLWQPGNTGGGAVDNAELLTVTVSETQVPANSSPEMPSDDYLASIAPVTAWAPSYVAPISKEDIVQSRPVIFDVSGIAFEVINRRLKKENPKGKFSNNVNQFTLNGRFFALNDPIGNTDSDTLLTRGYIKPTLAYNPVTQKYDSSGLEYIKDRPQLEKYEDISFLSPNAQANHPVQWNNNRSHDSLHFFMNPGYYQAMGTNRWQLRI